MIVRIIEHSSKDYHKMIELRLQVLLQPIGVPASYINLEKEKEDMLIGAFDEEKMIGCCVLTPKSDDIIQLRQMAVAEDRQGKRVGNAIITFAESMAKEKGYKVLVMHARNPVIEFYEKCGYKITGEEFYEVGIAHHKMQKEL